jgi:hypothetical protein
MPSQANIGEILDRAAHQQITARELDILVTKTRELSALREFELKRLQQLLIELESRRNYSDSVIG